MTIVFHSDKFKSDWVSVKLNVHFIPLPVYLAGEEDCGAMGNAVSLTIFASRGGQTSLRSYALTSEPTVELDLIGRIPSLTVTEIDGNPFICNRNW